jgi:cation diffusion facilitator CzcD-associated flavoprotein CzcO
MANLIQVPGSQKAFTKIDVFEQRATVGGLWNHTAPNVHDGDFAIPRSQPTTLPDTPTWAEGVAPSQFASPVYDLLEINIPHTLMNYSDHQFPQGSSLFPRHVVVKQYLHDYADGVRDLITLETQVLGVEKLQSGPREKWRLELHHLGSKETRTEEYDAVLIAGGHYNDPFIPQIPGLARLNEQYQGSVTHSKFYKRPDVFQNKVRQLICQETRKTDKCHRKSWWWATRRLV